MKSFWIILGLLAALTAFLWLRGRHHVADRGEHVRETAARAPQTAPEISPNHSGEAPAESTTNESTSAVAIATPDPPDPPPTANSAAEAAALVEDLQASYDERTTQETGDPDSDAEDFPESAVATDEKPINAAAPTIEYRDDGSMLLDGQYVVRGMGTEKSPYRVSWDLLVSAEQSYAPRLDMFEIPDRLSFLDGKYVQVSGYVFATTFRTDADELMILRNMWDGCCIGVPPSPYDSIEVTLRKPISTTNVMLDTVGVLRGRFRIDPYVRGSWLLGFYIVEDASVEFFDL